VCISWTNKGLHTITMHGASTKIHWYCLCPTLLPKKSNQFVRTYLHVTIFETFDRFLQIIFGLMQLETTPTPFFFNLLHPVVTLLRTQENVGGDSLWRHVFCSSEMMCSNRYFENVQC